MKKPYVGTRFPAVFLLKKSREEVEELQAEINKLKTENINLRHQLDNYNTRKQAKIMCQKESLYKALTDQVNSLQSKYAKSQAKLSKVIKKCKELGINII